MKPVLVLVGRPNVGKSTLFNRLTRGRDALVADVPGLTRDRQYGEGRRGNRPYLVVDTGGVTEDLDRSVQDKRMSMDAMMKEQTRQAVEEGDAIIFLVDGREGVTPADQELANYLRRTNKPVIVAVNKTEGLEPDVVTAEFHRLGLPQLVSISAKRGDGISDLVNDALAGFPESEETEIEFRIAPPPIEIIRADSKRFKQIMINLISNAFKFTKQGCVSSRRFSIRVHKRLM